MLDLIYISSDKIFIWTGLTHQESSLAWWGEPSIRCNAGIGRTGSLPSEPLPTSGSLGVIWI